MGDFKIDFTGIGVAKAGTTWIAKCLSEHPQVCIAIGKETNFFLLNNLASGLPVKNRFWGTSHNTLGMSWYEDRYRHHKPGQLRGEYSNAYLSDPECARLLHEHNPAVKLLCCFRNPVDMLYAGYYQLSRVHPIHETFEEGLARYPKFLNYVNYYDNLQPFLKRFPREQFHFMLYDDIQKDAPAVFKGICQFLGIDANFEPPSLRQKVNPRTVLRSKRLRDLRSGISAVMGSTNVMRRVRTIMVRLGMAGLMVKFFQKVNEKPGKAPPMSPETRARLQERFKAENAKLAAFLGRDLSAWDRPAPVQAQPASPPAAM